jgi:hypothetical protein
VLAKLTFGWQPVARTQFTGLQPVAQLAGDDVERPLRLRRGERAEFLASRSSHDRFSAISGYFTVDAFIVALTYPEF